MYLHWEQDSDRTDASSRPSCEGGKSSRSTLLDNCSKTIVFGTCLAKKQSRERTMKGGRVPWHDAQVNSVQSVWIVSLGMHGTASAMPAREPGSTEMQTCGAMSDE